MNSHDKESMATFSFDQSFYERTRNDRMSRLFARLTKKTPNLFLRGTDIMSGYTQVSGEYEAHIKYLIEHYAASGYSDFLIDVGANIGLTSCQSGNSFREVHMFEPNPDCFSVLKVNSKIALTNTRYHLYEYGLGTEPTRTTLKVPTRNWGGGFIHNVVEGYRDEVQEKSLKFDVNDPRNYNEVQIQIKNAKETFENLFESLGSDNLISGVIKIDVEGYEPTILMGIAQAIPPEVKVMIIFECWDENLNINSILSPFENRATCFRLAPNRDFIGIPFKLFKKSSFPKILKLLGLMLKPKISYKLSKLNDGDTLGVLSNCIDLVIEVAPRTDS